MLKKRITLFLSYDELMLLIYSLGQYVIIHYREELKDAQSIDLLQIDAISLLEKIAEIAYQFEKEI